MEIKLTMRNALLAASAAIFLGFLLQWMEQPDYGRSATGFQLLQQVESPLILLILIFPIGAAIIAYYAFQNDLNNPKLILSKKILIGMTILLVAVVFWFFSNRSARGIQIGIGAVLTILGGAGYYGAGYIKEPIENNSKIKVNGDEELDLPQK
jgi:hypothetical protein